MEKKSAAKPKARGLPKVRSATTKKVGPKKVKKAAPSSKSPKKSPAASPVKIAEPMVSEADADADMMSNNE